MGKENLKRLKDTIGGETIELLPRQITSIVDFTSFQEQLESIVKIVDDFTEELWINSNGDLGRIGNLLWSLKEGKISETILKSNVESLSYLAEDMFTLHDSLVDSNIFSNYAQKFYFVGTKLNVIKDMLNTVVSGYPLNTKGELPDRVLLLDYKEINTSTIDFLKYKLGRTFFITNKINLRKRLSALRYVNTQMLKENISSTLLYRRIMDTNILFEEGRMPSEIYDTIENNYRSFYISELIKYYNKLYSCISPQQVLKRILCNDRSNLETDYSNLQFAYEVTDPGLKNIFKDENSFSRMKLNEINENSADPSYKELCTLFRYSYTIKILYILCGSYRAGSYSEFRKSIKTF